jgi:hypothetical protein
LETISNFAILSFTGAILEKFGHLNELERLHDFRLKLFRFILKVKKKSKSKLEIMSQDHHFEDCRQN